MRLVANYLWATCLFAGLSATASAAPILTEKSQKADFVVETAARGLERPWGLEFLPDGRMIVTEKIGRLRIIDKEGELSPPVNGVPKVVARGQGGLLDVALDPNFADNRFVYLSYAEPRDGGGAGTSVARGRLDAEARALEDVEVIFRQEPGHTGGNHFGSRLAFAPDGNLFVTLGDRFDLRAEAQDVSNHVGKVVRIQPDGGVPKDNPFVGKTGAEAEIWSYGHRNAQAAAVNPATGALWTAEHGARGGDEVNIPQKGLNYGWPVISYGVDYSGAKLGVGTKKEGMEQPAFYWDPSIAPSGMAFYTGDKFPGWKGNVFVGALAGQLLARLEIDGGRVTREERLLTRLGARIRDVKQGPDGFLYVVTDAGDGRVLRLKPAEAS